MTHYLRRKGKTLVDIEATLTDLSTVVCLEEYSHFLLESNNKKEIINDFSKLQELRGEYWGNTQSETPDELTERRLRDISIKYDLRYVTD